MSASVIRNYTTAQQVAMAIFRQCGLTLQEARRPSVAVEAAVDANLAARQQRSDNAVAIIAATRPAELVSTTGGVMTRRQALRELATAVIIQEIMAIVGSNPRWAPPAEMIYLGRDLRLWDGLPYSYPAEGDDRYVDYWGSLDRQSVIVCYGPSTSGRLLYGHRDGIGLSNHYVREAFRRLALTQAAVLA